MKLLLSFLFLVLISCNKASHESYLPVDLSELKEFLAVSSGYSTDKIKYSDEIFIIDTDVKMPLSDAREHYLLSKNTIPDARTIQRVYMYTVSSGKAKTVKIFVSPVLSSEWQQAIDSAILHWNNTGSIVFMKKTANQNNASTVIESGDFFGGVAFSFYPSASGNPGSRMTINTGYDNIAFYSKIFVITHELGHIMGFTHTNGTYGSLIAGTPEADSLSVMNSVVGEWLGFSYYDLVAINTIY